MDTESTTDTEMTPEPEVEINPDTNGKVLEMIKELAQAQVNNELTVEESLKLQMLQERMEKNKLISAITEADYNNLCQMVSQKYKLTVNDHVDIVTRKITRGKTS